MGKGRQALCRLLHSGHQFVKVESRARTSGKGGKGRGAKDMGTG
jgi:hypothetical protein